MSRLKVAAIIPARLESSRLPGKILTDLLGKTLIERVYNNINSFDLFDSIYIATDSNEVIELCNQKKFNVIQTASYHLSGTSRLSEACKQVPAEIIVNIQGDEPFILKEQISDLVNGLINDNEADIATLIFKSSNYQESLSPNIVKVVNDSKNYALYFSRLPIPFNRDNPKEGIWNHHLGVYAYKKEFLLNFSKLIPCKLEQIEKLEQLSFLTNNYKILLVETLKKTLGIDTKEDLQLAKEILKNE